MYYLAVPTNNSNFPVQGLKSFESREDLMNFLSLSDPDDDIFNCYYLCVVVTSKRITLGKFIPNSVITLKSCPLHQTLTNGKGSYPPAVVKLGQTLRDRWVRDLT